MLSRSLPSLALLASLLFSPLSYAWCNDLNISLINNTNTVCEVSAQGMQHPSSAQPAIPKRILPGDDKSFVYHARKFVTTDLRLHLSCGNNREIELATHIVDHLFEKPQVTGDVLKQHGLTANFIYNKDYFMPRYRHYIMGAIEWTIRAT